MPAVSYTTSGDTIAFCSPSALTPFFWFTTDHIAWNHKRSGLCVS